MRKYLFVFIAVLTMQQLSGKEYPASLFGIKSDGTTLNTSSIQKGIDYIHEQGGGVLVFHVGRYMTGTVYLKSNVTLHLKEGAVLVGSTNPFDYTKDSYIGRTSLIFAVKQTNVGVTGKGTINGQGFITANNLITLIQKGVVADPLHHDRPDEVNRPHLIYFRECSQVKIKGIFLKDPASWTQAYDQCTDVLIDGISVDSKSYWNNDGLDIIDSEKVVIRNSFFDAADDAICFKSHEVNKINQQVLVENCVARSSASAIKFGTASKGGFRDFTIRNITIYDTYRSAVTFAAVDGGVVENISVDSIRAIHVGNVFYLRIGDRWSSGRKPLMRNITVSNVYAEVSPSKADAGYNYEGPIEHLPRNVSPATIIGLPEYRIEDVTLRNITMAYPGGGDSLYAKRGLTPEELDGIPEMRKSYPEYSQFKELPAWGVYVRHADRITLDRVTFRAKDTDYRPALVTDDVHGITIKGCMIEEPDSSDKTQFFPYKTSAVSSTL